MKNEYKPLTEKLLTEWGNIFWDHNDYDHDIVQRLIAEVRRLRSETCKNCERLRAELAKRESGADGER